MPIAGEVVWWISEDIQSSVMAGIRQDTTTETQAEAEAAREYSNGRSAALQSAQDAVDRAALSNGDIDWDTREDLRRAARTAAGVSHSDGAQWNSESDGN